VGAERGGMLERKRKRKAKSEKETVGRDREGERGRGTVERERGRGGGGGRRCYFCVERDCHRRHLFVAERMNFFSPHSERMYMCGVAQLHM